MKAPLLACVFAAALLAAAPSAGQAPSTSSGQAPSTSSGQAYPAKPITVVVPFSAGGPTDMLARIMGERMRSTRSPTPT